MGICPAMWGLGLSLRTGVEGLGPRNFPRQPIYPSMFYHMSCPKIGLNRRLKNHHQFFLEVPYHMSTMVYPKTPLQL